MVKLTSAIAAVSMLIMGPAAAEMVAGTFKCSGSKSQLTWTGAAPEALMMRGSTCGASKQACPTTTSELLDLVEKKSCVGSRDGSTLDFVCSRGNENDLLKIIGDFCEAMIP